MYDLLTFSICHFVVVFPLSWWCPLKHKSLKFWWSPNYLFFPLANQTFGIKAMNSLPNLRSWIFTPMFSSTSFMISGPIFKSLVYFKLNFCLSCKRIVCFHEFSQSSSCSSSNSNFLLLSPFPQSLRCLLCLIFCTIQHFLLIYRKIAI